MFITQGVGENTDDKRTRMTLKTKSSFDNTYKVVDLKYPKLRTLIKLRREMKGRQPVNCLTT